MAGAGLVGHLQTAAGSAGRPNGARSNRAADHVMRKYLRGEPRATPTRATDASAAVPASTQPSIDLRSWARNLAVDPDSVGAADARTRHTSRVYLFPTNDRPRD